MRKNKAVSLLLAVVMVCALFTPVAAADYADVQGHWAADAISRWSDSGIIQGDGTGFRPDDAITRAETATIINNVISYIDVADNTFSDVDSSAWYADAVLKLNAAGVMQGDGDGTARPAAAISREEAMVLFARAFGFKTANTSTLSQYGDASQISGWATDAVGQMTAAGFIQGNDGNLRPKDAITRAEIVTILDNMIGLYATDAGTYQDNYGSKLAIIKAGNTTISNSIVGGIVISPQVGNGSVQIINTQVSGNLTNLAPNASISTSGSTVESTTGIESGGNSSLIFNNGGGTSNRTYTILFNANGGTWGSNRTRQITYNRNTRLSAKAPSNPTRDGYDFAGWYTTRSGAENLSASYEINMSSYVTRSMTLYAGWQEDNTPTPSPSPSPEPQQLTVTFISMGAPTVVPVEEGKTVAEADMPAEPAAREGFTFEGWYTGTTTDSEEFTAETIVEENMVVYAVWTADEEIAESLDTIEVAETANADMAIAYPASAVAGETITVLVTPETGYEVTGVAVSYVIGEGQAVPVENVTKDDDGTYSFVIPADVADAVFTVTPTIAQSAYTVTVAESITGGTVTADTTTEVHYGETITLTVTPAEGYKLESLTATAEGETEPFYTADVEAESFTFTMPDANVTVNAAFAEENPAPAAVSEVAVTLEGEAVSVTFNVDKGFDFNSYEGITDPEASLTEINELYTKLLTGSEDEKADAAKAIGNDVIVVYSYEENGEQKVLTTKDGVTPLVKNKLWGSYLFYQDAEGYTCLEGTSVEDGDTYLGIAFPAGKSWITTTGPSTNLVDTGWLAPVAGKNLQVEVIVVNDGNISTGTDTVAVPENIAGAETETSGETGRGSGSAGTEEVTE